MVGAAAMAAFTPREAAVEAVAVAAVATEVEAVATAANLPAAQAPKHLASQQRLPALALPMEAPVLGISQLCSIMEMGIETETETVAPARHPVILLALRAHHHLLIPLPAKDIKSKFSSPQRIQSQNLSMECTPQ